MYEKESKTNSPNVSKNIYPSISINKMMYPNIICRRLTPIQVILICTWLSNSLFVITTIPRNVSLPRINVAIFLCACVRALRNIGYICVMNKVH